MSFILTDISNHIAILTINRPEALNAINDMVVADLVSAVKLCIDDENVGVLILTGAGDKAFVAGADIKQMQSNGPKEALTFGQMGQHMTLLIENSPKPVIAAVAGYALGGGCEMAMMCDFIIAADTAKFGQPEITLGVLPGAGGTQRLTRLVGKSKAMDMCLTGRTMDAEEAERAGLVSRVVPAKDLLDETMKTATAIAGMSRPSTYMVKEAVNRAYETTLSEGIRFERRLFYSTFATEDQKEGMAAFSEKRKPKWKNR